MNAAGKSRLAAPILGLLAWLFIASPLAAQVCSDLAGSSIYLVRHAEKQEGPDPGLTEAGHARAEALREELSRVSLDAIYVTQWQRTQLTAAPTAEAQGLPLTVSSTEALTLAEHVLDIITDLNARHCGETVLLVGHSNTIPRIIYSLTGKQVAEIGEWTYDRLFHIRFEAGRPVELIRTEFGAPNPTGGF